VVVVGALDKGPAEETVAAIQGAGDVTDPAFPAQLIGTTLDT
jgi:3-oxoacyl-[acyl-carrier protein] reductase